MRKNLFILLLISTFLPGLSAQSYWQQDVEYEIHVSLDDQAHRLKIEESLGYTNNSPDELNELFIHLWPNAYLHRKTAFAKQKLGNGSTRFHRAKESDRGGVFDFSVSMDGEELVFEEWNGNPDVIRIILPQPLKPGEKLSLYMPFEVKIPASFSRLGHVKQQYQITQWYAKPAVYDHEGWHPMPYLDQGEFYSEFGTFDVYIDVPKNYVVGATGDLAEDDPEREWLAHREARSRELLAELKDSPDSLKAPFELEFPEDKRKVLHFHQEKVHDFAWFCDKQYYVLSKVIQTPHEKRDVHCVAMFNHKDRQYWEKGADYVGQAVEFYSQYLGDYPYNHATAVDGALSAGAGMEYPNITVLGSGGGAESLELVTLHEVGHNWFYGILGSNERRYPWLDEGLNTYFETRYWLEKHNDEMEILPDPIQKAINLDLTHTRLNYLSYVATASGNVDQQISGTSEKFTNLNYGVIVYNKTGMAFRYLGSYLGQETMDKCWSAYYESWKFKHPYPADIQAVFEEVSDQDLAWFFEGYLQGREKPDFRIADIDGNKVTVKHDSKLQLPVAVTVKDEEGEEMETLWTPPFTGEHTLTFGTGTFHIAQADPEEVIPELKRDNNRLKNKSLFARCRPIEFKFGYTYPSTEKHTLNWLPLLGYNTTDGFAFGLLVHHHFFPKKKFGFHVMPMFGLKSTNLTGSAGANYRITPSKIFSEVRLRSVVSSYSTYFRWRQSLDFAIMPKEMRSPLRHSVALKVHSFGDRVDWTLSPDDFLLPVFGEAGYALKMNRALDNGEVNVNMGGNIPEAVMRVDLTASYNRSLLKKGTFSVRGFYGMMKSPDTGAPSMVRYGLSGSGDPFGEQILLDRAGVSPWMSHQQTADHGRFSSMTGRRYDRNIWAFNGGLALPWTRLGSFLQLSFFGDVGGGRSADMAEGEVLYDAGFRLKVLSGLVAFNVPVIGSVYTDGSPADFKNLWQNITFTLEPTALFRGSGLGGIISF